MSEMSFHIQDENKSIKFKRDGMNFEIFVYQRMDVGEENVSVSLYLSVADGQAIATALKALCGPTTP